LENEIKMLNDKIMKLISENKLLQNKIPLNVEENDKIKLLEKEIENLVNQLNKNIQQVNPRDNNTFDNLQSRLINYKKNIQLKK